MNLLLGSLNLIRRRRWTERGGLGVLERGPPRATSDF
jgi:hypothetical protein